VTYRLLSSVLSKYGSKLGIVNCTFPRDLYKKWRNGLPGTISVHFGRPCLTAALNTSMEPLRCRVWYHALVTAHNSHQYCLIRFRNCTRHISEQGVGGESADERSVGDHSGPNSESRMILYARRLYEVRLPPDINKRATQHARISPLKT
jgi:hypothetical protein